METIVIDDAKSIAGQMPNKKGTENSVRTYYLLIKELLANKGWVFKDEVKDTIKRNFGPSFSKDDLRPIKVGKNGWRPKWENSLDWAIVLGRKNREFVANRSAIFCTDVAKLASDCLSSRKTKMTKLCKKCKTPNNLNRKTCEVCDASFPKAKTKRVRVPLMKSR